MRSLLVVLAVPAVLWAAAPAAVAAPCPTCPAGCVPTAWVAEWKAPPSGAPACPAGCVSLELVRSLSDDRSCAVAQPPAPASDAASPDGTALGAVAVASPPEAVRPVDATRQRIIVFPTALGPPKGQSSFTGYGAALWHYEYGASDSATLGLYAVLPIGVAGVFPSVSLHSVVDAHVAVGAGAVGGIVTAYTTGDSLWAAFGHAEVTYFDDENIFNVGLLAGTAGANGETADGVLLLPNVGYRRLISRTWSFQTEITPPFVTGGGSDVNGRVWVLNYGLRVHGDAVFGDFGFSMPIAKGFFDEAWKYLPLGVPYFTLGFHI